MNFTQVNLEWLDDLFTQGPKACVGGPDKDCLWKHAWIELSNEYDEFKISAVEQNDKDVAYYKKAFQNFKENTDAVRHDLNSDNRRLYKRNKGLTLKSETLEQEFVDTKRALKAQLSHTNERKEELQKRVLFLLEQLRLRDHTVSVIRINWEESKTLVKHLTNEVRKQDAEIEGLRNTGVELKQQYDADVKHLVEKNDKLEADLEAFYHNALDFANANFLELENKLLEREVALCKLLDDEKARSAELCRNGSIVQHTIDNTLQDAFEAIGRVKNVMLMTDAKNKVVQSDMKKVTHALKVLRDEVASFYLDSEKMRDKVYQILGVDKKFITVLPEVTPALATKESYDSVKNIAAAAGKPASELGCNTLELIEKERRNIDKFVSSLTNWSVTLSSQRDRYDKQIHHWEDSVCSERMKHIYEMEFANRKLCVYKRLIIKLRGKLDREVKSPRNVKDESKKNDTDKARWAALPKIGLRVVKKPAAAAGATAKPRTKPLSKTSEDACCAAFKFMLEESEKVLQRMEEKHVAAQNASHR